jgi:nicotinate-nucleotide pyrophosphorylase (carboxylating)
LISPADAGDRCIGPISLETVAAVTASGVDLISSGRITHSASSLDVGLVIAGA